MKLVSICMSKLMLLSIVVECSHNMVLQYFMDSIGRNKFEAILCNSYINFTMGYCSNNTRSFMGDGCQFTVKGDYFLTIKV